MPAPTVSIHEGNGWTRFTVKADPYGWLEGWIYADGRPNVYARECTPIAAMPSTPAGDAISRAMIAAENDREVAWLKQRGRL